MAIVKYGVSRNMPCEDKDGKEVRMCLCVIEHENGYQQRHVISEDMIRHVAGSDPEKVQRLIEMEVQEAALGGGIATEVIRKPS